MPSKLIKTVGQLGGTVFYDESDGCTLYQSFNNVDYLRCHTRKSFSLIGYKSQSKLSEECQFCYQTNMAHDGHERFELKHFILMQIYVCIKVRATIYTNPNTNHRVPDNVLNIWFENCRSRFFVDKDPESASASDLVRMKCSMLKRLRWYRTKDKGKIREVFKENDLKLYNCPDLNEDQLEELEKVAIEFEMKHFREALYFIETSKIRTGMCKMFSKKEACSNLYLIRFRYSD